MKIIIIIIVLQTDNGEKEYRGSSQKFVDGGKEKRIQWIHNVQVGLCPRIDFGDPHSKFDKTPPGPLYTKLPVPMNHIHNHQDRLHHHNHDYKDGRPGG